MEREELFRRVNFTTQGLIKCVKQKVELLEDRIKHILGLISKDKVNFDNTQEEEKIETNIKSKEPVPAKLEAEEPKRKRYSALKAENRFKSAIKKIIDSRKERSFRSKFSKIRPKQTIEISFNKFSSKDLTKMKMKMMLMHSMDNITTIYEPSNESESHDDVQIHKRDFLIAEDIKRPLRNKEDLEKQIGDILIHNQFSKDIAFKQHESNQKIPEILEAKIDNENKQEKNNNNNNTIESNNNNKEYLPAYLQDQSLAKISLKNTSIKENMNIDNKLISEQSRNQRMHTFTPMSTASRVHVLTAKFENPVDKIMFKRNCKSRTNLATISSGRFLVPYFPSIKKDTKDESEILASLQSKKSRQRQQEYKTCRSPGIYTKRKNSEKDNKYMIKKELHNAYTLMKNRRNLFTVHPKCFHYHVAMLKSSIRHHIEIPNQVKSLSPEKSIQIVVQERKPTKQNTERNSEHMMKISSFNFNSQKSKEEKYKTQQELEIKKG